MTLYARSDVMSVAIPAEGGGCGEGHSRPVRNGAPVKLWGLTCMPCEKVLRDDIARDIGYNKKDGSHYRHEVGMWSENSLHVPKTPDELELIDQYEREGKQQLAREANARAEQSIRDWHSREAEQLQQYAAEQRMAEMVSRMELLEAELERLRAGNGDPVAQTFTTATNIMPAPGFQEVAAAIQAGLKSVDQARADIGKDPFGIPETQQQVVPQPDGVPYTPAHACADCGTEIVRKPGQKGATPKRCDDCRGKRR